MPTEVWRPVDFLEGAEVLGNRYLVSNLCRVWAIISDREVSQRVHKNGYCDVTLSSRPDKIRKCPMVHRLVALAFLDPVEGHEEVDHIDRERTNNHLTNLRWATSIMNKDNSSRKSETSKHITEATLKSGRYEYWQLVIKRKDFKFQRQYSGAGGGDPRPVTRLICCEVDSIV